MKFIVSTTILLFSALMIVNLHGMFFSKAEAATSEQLCRGFNALRTKTEVEKFGFTLFNLAPRTCKIIHKDVPDPGYVKYTGDETEGAMMEIGDLAARCWWMWLEGTKDDMFGTTWTGEKKCFICYDFNINKDVGSFSATGLKQFLQDTQHIVIDKSNKCNIQGGGWCREVCESDEKETPSSRCPSKKVDGEIKKEVCCNKKVECLNKGGVCSDECGEGLEEYKGWSCKGSEGEKCCIEENNFLSYERYIQEYEGEGKAIIDVEGIEDFRPLEETYAITYVSKTALFGDLRRFLWKSDPYPEEVTNAILISRLNDVEGLCDIQSDISGE
ncbi:hypothetical protein KY358_01420 [Candidatus Woesearchaeota archaeon]|nr:hypothetical protein [Candidatus Woesearchaeota archaeon]